MKSMATKQKWLRFSLRSLLIAITVFGLLSAWGTQRFKSNTWHRGWSQHILADTPNKTESLVVRWLEKRGFEEIQNTNSVGRPNLGRVLRNRDPTLRYYCQFNRTSCSSLYVSVDVRESAPPNQQMSVLISLGIGYYDIWPWETRAYREAADRLCSDFNAWFEKELPAELIASTTTEN
ncbi:MAG: hypothetical protein O3C40_35015 [Planctomycetota bacterium]|nr:hypothetical protein [Planctomycetota bacterium]